MSVGFKAVQWNRDKQIYDAILLASVAIFIGTFIAAEAWLHRIAINVAYLVAGVITVCTNPTVAPPA